MSINFFHPNVNLLLSTLFKSLVYPEYSYINLNLCVFRYLTTPGITPGLGRTPGMASHYGVTFADDIQPSTGTRLARMLTTADSHQMSRPTRTQYSTPTIDSQDSGEGRPI